MTDDQELPPELADVVKQISETPLFIPCMAGSHVVAAKPTEGWPDELECYNLAVNKLTIQVDCGRFHFIAWLCPDHMEIFKGRFHILGTDGVTPPEAPH